MMEPEITLDLIEEDIPAPVRLGGGGREAIKWEELLAPIKEHESKSFRVWTYDKRTAAASRANQVSSRLFKVKPHEKWVIAVRQIPNSEQFGVYTMYAGHWSKSEVAKRQHDHERRSANAAARTAAARNNGEVPSDDAAAVAAAAE
jgi:hypothetical protein